ncbi:Winged helix-turn-helix [Chryseobacterium piscicola]|uniref:Winged helix-turn-helix n=1 Tax=Chryseobacterium piscicola TaxID=551459 RepID=A0A1N7N3B3_9FLAO|nr:winged helix-turn-helix domain-containing protein [Chryseobacterium piscicola]PQA93772.1 hypothetical protein B0A70_08260 [Chryseobacterium piscicola]SIS92832.1 Winged helix-turn-helix [Chryseobacterium piscicola]
MDIKIKTLKYFNLTKKNGRSYSDLISLDRYLVNVEKERIYLGEFLIAEIDKMITQGLIDKKNEKYSITDKGTEYLMEFK